MEMDPKYVDVIVKRWQDFTGQQAVREGDQIKFDDMHPALSEVEDAEVAGAPL
jgi:hypothetical protein